MTPFRALLTGALLAAVPTFAFAAPDLFITANQADSAFMATIAAVKQGPTALSYPPIYHLTFVFKDVQMLGGTPVTATDFGYITQEDSEAQQKAGVKVIGIVANDVDAGGPSLKGYYLATDANVALTTKAMAIPIGWTLVGAESVCPWNTWGNETHHQAGTCARCGRPADATWPLPLTMKVEQVIPADVKEFENPYGDGVFTLTVTNTGTGPVTVPSLWTDGKNILWDSSLIIISDAAPHVLSQATPPAGVTEVSLKAGESVSTQVNTLRLPDIQWPQGGSRVYFRFAVGRLAGDSFFYYYSKRHDAMRAAVASVLPTVTVTPMKDAQVSVASDGGIPVVDITCPKGIGSASLSRVGDAWPATTKIVLHLKGMENFALVTRDTHTIEVHSEPNIPIGQSIATTGNGTAQARQLTETDPLWLPVTHIDTNGFTITVPAAAFGDAATATLSWIDFYRG